MEILLTIIVVVIIFLVIRAFWLWYWRVNVIIDKLTAIESHLSRMAPPVPSDENESAVLRNFREGL